MPQQLRRIEDFFRLCGDPPSAIPEAQSIAAAEVPDPYRRMLAHNGHMTVALESFHDSTLELRVLSEHTAEPFYARKIQLLHPETRRILQFGIVRLNLDYSDEPVRQRILARDTPLGRILLEHGFMTRVVTHDLLRISLNHELADALGVDSKRERPTTFGRIATVNVDNEPAVELLEIVTPQSLAL